MMRKHWQFLIVWTAPAVLAVAALAQTSSPAVPTPTPTPAAAEAKSPTVRVVAPSPDAAPNVSETLPMDPGEAAQTGPIPAGEKKANKGEFVFAPIPISDPACGSGLGVAAVYTFAKKNTEDPSPPTTLAAGGFYTDNGSWSGAAMMKLYLKQDRYRAAFGGGLGTINYDLSAGDPTRQGTPISQEFTMAVGQFLVGLGKRWYAGVRASYGTTKVTLQEPWTGPLPIPPLELDKTIAALGLKVERDSRDNIFYPMAGSRLQLLVNHNDTGFGSDYNFTKTWLTYADYIKLSEPVVLAVEGAGCYSSDGAPFFGLCYFGAKNMLRGYTAGRYLERWMLGTQAEVRWRLANRWITTAFAGVADVKPAFPASKDTEWLPGGGVGVHWIAAPENMITVRAEYAWGTAGAHGFYISIGQAF
jgi:outer membrane protein assembly factor BamA